MVSNELLAKRALEHVRAACVHKSSNKWHTKSPAKQSRSYRNDYVVNAMRADFRKGLLGGYSFYGDVAEHNGTGNCGEMSFMAWNFVCRNGGTAAVLCFAQPGDHQFAVVGFRAGDETKPMSEWDQNAYICDAWANIVCPPAQYEIAWKQKMRKWHTDNKQLTSPTGLIDPTSSAWFHSVSKTPYEVLC
jgi:hypothetical protein